MTSSARSSPPKPPARTQIATGVVPPAPPAAKPASKPAPAGPSKRESARPTSRQPVPGTPEAPAAAAGRPGPTDFQAQRHTRVGTHIAGTEGLQVAGSDGPKVRLSPGALVPGTRYRIVKWLGEGGMGVVYEAEHIDIERRVAFKILRFDLSRQPRMAQVFRDEARAASRLGSPNIVEIYDFGELPDGRLFFCMELLEGKHLVPSSEQDCMEPGDVIAVLRQVCKGLHAAHKAGVIHRDIKPENIISVTRDGRRGMVKIVDFGISSMLAAGQEDQGGGIAGTPHYMAPEQITGDAFDGRLDVYAVGCTAYELLVGRPPFDADGLEDLLRKHISDTPPPLSKVRPDREFPKPLEAVVMRCLEKDPRRRFRDMADLEAALCEAQIAAKLHTPWDDLPLPELDDQERRERLLRDMPSPLVGLDRPRRKWVWPTIAGITSIAAIGAAAFALTRGPTQEQRDIVEVLVTDARDAAAKANWVVPPPGEPEAPTALLKVLQLEGIEGAARRMADQKAAELRSEFAKTLFNHGDQLWQIPQARPMARDWYAWGLLFDPDNGDAFERSGLTHGALADFGERVQHGDFTAAELALSRALAASVEQDETRRAELEQQYVAAAEATELSFMGEQLFAQFERATNIRSRHKTVVAEKQPEEDLTDVLEEVLLEPPQAAGAAAEPAPAEPVAEAPTAVEEENKKRIKKRVDAMLGKAKRDPQQAAQLADQGMSALRAGRRGEAESLFNQAIAFDRTNGLALTGLSDVYFDLGQNQKAIVYAERAVESSPRNRTYRLKLGDAYFKVLRYRDALGQYEEAHKLGESRAADRIAKVKAKLGG